MKLNRSGDCKECPLRGQCIAARNKDAKKPMRTLYIADQEHEENLSDKMREKIDDPAYRALYGRRMQIIEPCFSDIVYCKGMNRFSLRSKIKVNWTVPRLVDIIKRPELILTH
jgi:hypothetical protein